MSSLPGRNELDDLIQKAKENAPPELNDPDLSSNEAMDLYIKQSIVKALKVLNRILDDTSSKDSDQLRAAADILKVAKTRDDLTPTSQNTNPYQQIADLIERAKHVQPVDTEHQRD